MTTAKNPDQFGSWRLIRAGLVLLLISTTIAALIFKFENPLMALAAHLQSLGNALMLIAFGIIWPRITMHLGTSGVTIVLLIVGTFLITLTLAVAAWYGVGGSVFPISGGTHIGTPTQELIVKVSAAIATVSATIGVVVVAWKGIRSSGL